ncbi:hypothetical protein BGZ99_006892 [Dissophora globulifera]|uniref:tRNA-uridine aminocarboxypropyltransferase n=1 Tax=Dissophora globulifera TaxID=979702 RepID=A0A9P6UYK1_9FUNG|nr:hypothetical protein BGZ99_006892 [Dissophora globulifera]
MTGSPQLADLPDNVLLRIFSFLAMEPETDAAQPPSEEAVPSSSTTQKKLKRRDARRSGPRVAGPGARILCRLCCCSHRLNHLASADQLWQPLTLARFPDRHWPTTDQKNLELIRVRRQHMVKLLQPSTSPSSARTHPVDNVQKQDQEKERRDTGDQGDKQEGEEEEEEEEEGLPSKKQKRTKFYSRFEQRAHRRKFVSLDPQLTYTPLAWTNTIPWSWKRTYFGDCRFVESKDVRTPNRIDHALHRNNAVAARQECERCWRPARSCICSALTLQQYCNCRVRIMILQHPRCQVSIGTIRILKMSFKYCQIVIGKDFSIGRSAELDQALADPNCTPLLLYPSHSAVDIQTLAQQARTTAPAQVQSSESSAAPTPGTNLRYFCNDCIHRSQHSASITGGSGSGSESGSAETTDPVTYPYNLVIALDGSWSHAKIMYRCNPRLQQFTQIKFPNPPQSIYHDLKPEPKVTYTSTAEAVGQAVALLGWPADALDSTGDASSADLLLEVDLPNLVLPFFKLLHLTSSLNSVN